VINNVDDDLLMSLAVICDKQRTRHRTCDIHCFTFVMAAITDDLATSEIGIQYSVKYLELGAVYRAVVVTRLTD